MSKAKLSYEEKLLAIKEYKTGKIICAVVFHISPADVSYFTKDTSVFQYV